jgi:hypothetical protein
MLARAATEIRKVSHYVRQAVTTSSHWHQVPLGEDRKPRWRAVGPTDGIDAKMVVNFRD